MNQKQEIPNLVLPCPFCGGRAVCAQARIYCGDCGVGTMPTDDMEAACMIWNRRTVRPATSHKSASVFRNLERVIESMELDARHAAGAIIELRFLEKLLVAIATLADTAPAPAPYSPAAVVAEFVDSARSGFPA